MLALVSQANAAETMQIDSKVSKIEFVGSKEDGKHSGGFKKVEGSATVDKETPTAGAISLVIDAKSLWSDDEKLTDHLKNADFFNVREYPTITFTSTKIVVTGEKSGEIIGNLTMLGVKVETTVPITAEVSDNEIHLHAKFKIDRTKWGMKYGVGKIKNDVEMDAHLVLTK